MTCTRRDVLYTIGLAAASTAIPACGGSDSSDSGVPNGTAELCGTNLCFKISENPELQMAGGIVLFTQAAGKKILVQRTGDTFLALSAICTHAGCTVIFNGSDKFNCPCHGSSFDSATGNRLAGPAPTGLQNFATSVNGDDVTITLA